MLFRTTRRVVAAAVAGLLGVTGLTLAPGALAAPNPKLEQVQAQIVELEHRAESAAERYNDAQSRLDAVDRKLSGARSQLEKQRKELGEIRGAVGQFARATYVSGGVDTSLQVILADDPAEFLAQAAALDQVARSQDTALRRSQTAQLRLAQSEAAVAQQEDSARQIRDEMAGLRAEADASLAEAQNVLDQLEEEERQRLAEMQAQARADALAEARAAAAASSGGNGGNGGNNGGNGGNETSAGGGGGGGNNNNDSLSGGGGYSGGSRAAKAVAYALAQVGDSYVAARSGPDAFDCSGLTLAAWRAAGVSLPHYSGAQWDVTKRISLSEAQPGDLAFYFKNGAHHVGLYIGNGKMVHAANPSSGVLISAVLGPWYDAHFSGMGRVVG